MWHLEFCPLEYPTPLQNKTGRLISFFTPNPEKKLKFETQSKLVNVYCNTKLRHRIETKQAVSYFTDEEFGSGSEDGDLQSEMSIAEEEQLLMQMDEMPSEES